MLFSASILKALTNSKVLLRAAKNEGVMHVVEL